ncbi:MAG: GTP-binding protein [Thermoplasmata archaeon]|nr:MAG: GTP-binding protein [Thermoplasmata archaeon]
MPEAKPPKFKICLVGDGGVGKTSLIKRYVFDQFSDDYIVTLGTKITVKDLKISNPINGYQDVRLLIWDIIGQQGFHQLLKNAYFEGSQGILATCDVTRKATLQGLESWVETAESVAGELPMVVLGNKYDIEGEQRFGLDEIKSFASRSHGTEAYLSSAKTGFNVERAFQKLTENILNDNI